MSKEERIIQELAKETNEIAAAQGIQAAYNHVLRAEVALRLRRPSLAIYDHGFHFIGGAQRYGLTMASALQDRFDITLVANYEVSHRDFMDWYGLDLAACRIKVVKLPFYEERGLRHIDPAIIPPETRNPFHSVSRESGGYDIFVNACMNEMVYPLSGLSVLVCHFPERRPRTYFYADRYTYLVCNSLYPAEWVKKKWKLTSHQQIYPPVDMENAAARLPKRKLILSVARFEVEGSKRQKEMIEAFLSLDEKWPEIAKDWSFILAGGSSPDNPYLAGLEKMIAEKRAKNIQLNVNLPLEELNCLYQEATLFWHMCGLKNEDPSAIEHFGMTTVEAMQNKAVPIVYDGGGLREIVDHGVNGFRVRSKAELLEYTLKLFRDEKLVQALAQSAQEKAQAYSRPKFEAEIRAFFEDMLKTYISAPEAGSSE